MNEAPTFGSLFAGIGGLDLGLERAGWRCAWQVEIDPFCDRVLAVRWPDTRRVADVQTFPVGLPDEALQVDLVCGGFPCQDLSVAGQRRGLRGERSGLFFEFMRVTSELRPHWLLLENVPGWLSSHQGRDFATALVEMDERGYDPIWVTLDSQHFGVPQRRRRVFLVGHLRGPCRCTPEVLLESEGGAGHPAAGREEGAEVAAGLTGGSYGDGVHPPGRRKENDVNLVVARQTGRGYWNDDGHAGLRAHPGGHAENLVTAFNLRGREEGARVEPCEEASLRASPGGSSRSYVAFGDHGADQRGRGPTDQVMKNLIAAPLRTNPYNNSDPTMERQMLVHGLSAEGHDASEDGTGRGTPLVIQDARAMDKAQHGLSVSDIIRRLTPLEYERLQGFPDGWTCLCGATEAMLAECSIGPEIWRASDWRTLRLKSHTARCRCPDSPRYRALGNAVTVTVAEWIGLRVKEAMKEEMK